MKQERRAGRPASGVKKVQYKRWVKEEWVEEMDRRLGELEGEEVGKVELVPAESAAKDTGLPVEAASKVVGRDRGGPILKPGGKIA